MSDHADTIRPETPTPWYFDGWDVFTSSSSGGPRGDGHRMVFPFHDALHGTFHPSQAISADDVRFMVEAVNRYDALVAERQQAIDERDAARAELKRLVAGDDHGTRAESATAQSPSKSEARCEQAIDALREIRDHATAWDAKRPHTRHIRAVAADALVSLGEKPTP